LTAAAFEDFVEVGEVAMIVTIEATFTSHHATRATFLPFVVKHGVANLL
jgi:hypothetical protein